MGKGDVYPSEHSSYRDPATGAAIHQMTRHPSISHPAYFLNSSFTRDGKSIFFTSYRTGAAQIFEVEFPGGAIRQLTADRPVHPYSPVQGAGNSIVFVRGGEVWEIDRDTLAERRIAALPDAQLGEPSLGDGGRWITAAAKQGAQPGIFAGRADGSEWRFIPFPRTVIHPQFHPAEPEWIEFAADPAPRIHRVRRDGAGLECLYQHTNDEFVVHETFLGRTGDLVYTVWPRLLCRLDWRTGRRSVIAEFNAWHITPDRAGARILCDTNHPDLGMFLIDAATGARRQVCLTQSSNRGTQWTRSSYAMPEDFAAARSAEDAGALSWLEVATDTVYGPQWTHPHPAFSADERYATFASDRTGTTQVYVVELI